MNVLVNKVKSVSLQVYTFLLDKSLLGLAVVEKFSWNSLSYADSGLWKIHNHLVAMESKLAALEKKSLPVPASSEALPPSQVGTASLGADLSAVSVPKGDAGSSSQVPPNTPEA